MEPFLEPISAEFHSIVSIHNELLVILEKAPDLIAFMMSLLSLFQVLPEAAL